MLLFGTACSMHHAAFNSSKLDPAFAALIAGQTKDGISSYPHQPEPIDEKANGQAPPEKRYECIVYTKQAGALRKKGIVINSELPDFVTARATLKQIKQMASMAEVTYIEAPKTNFPNQQRMHPDPPGFLLPHINILFP